MTGQSRGGWLNWNDPSIPSSQKVLRPARIIRAATLVDEGGRHHPWWWIKHKVGTRQTFGSLAGVTQMDVAAAMTVAVPPDAPAAVRVDFPDWPESRLFVVVAEKDRPFDDEGPDGEEFTGVRDPRTGSELWVWQSGTVGRGAESYTVLSGDVARDVDEVLLVGALSVLVSVTARSFAEVGWDGLA